MLLWTGDLEGAAGAIELAIAQAIKYSLAPYHAVGLTLKGQLMLARGDAFSAVDLLRQAREAMRVEQYNIVAIWASCLLAEALSRSGDTDEAYLTIENALARATQSGEKWWLPEVLRIRGEILLARPQPDLAGAEETLAQSINCARKQFALSWELKAANTLAEIWNRQGRIEEARAMLEGIYLRFTEGFQTRDLAAARRLIDKLSSAD